ncbi:hypothetical protein CCR75_007843 [Bremia lactucae]|uniref:Uncharacterized protein n=1 Tax=Bremia lactucae TaxID=4779 RepID=A0A976IC89_BRELC|nr:hypothetical protein CCR75_007841 [Bremia lactucae]TDH67462.1 hypothetical protein CCR75_007843 [Bremia lactucae]
MPKFSDSLAISYTLQQTQLTEDWRRECLQRFCEQYREIAHSRRRGHGYSGGIDFYGESAEEKPAILVTTQITGNVSVSMNINTATFIGFKIQPGE